MYSIVRSYRDQSDGGIVCHFVKVEGKADPELIEYETVIGGISWPSEGSPGYYVIMGQRPIGKEFRSVIKNAKPTLTFLMEFEAPSLKDMIEHLIDDAKITLCDTFYCDMGSNWDGFAEAVWTYTAPMSASIGLLQAPFTTNFQFGIQSIAERIEQQALEVPNDTILRSQIERMEVKDLQNKPDVYYYAVNALRYLICGVEKYSAGPIPPQIRAKITRDRGRRPGGFMAA